MKRLPPAAVAALGIVLTLPILAGCGEDADQKPKPDNTPAGQSGRPAQSPQASDSASVGAWIDDLPRGQAPRVPYVLGATVTLPDRSTVRLRHRHVSGYNSITPFDDGFLATDTRYFEGTMGLQRYDRAGALVRDLGAVAAAPVTSADGIRACWITFTPPEVTEGGPQRLTCMDLATGDESWQTLDHGAGLLWVARVEEEVTYRTRSRHEQVWRTGLTGPPVLVRTDRRGHGSRRIRDHVAPDGRHVLRAGGRRVRILHGGRVVASSPAPARGTFLTAVAWEDDDHVLLGYLRGRRTAIVRMSVDGEMELALPWSRVRPGSELGIVSPPGRLP